jgi:hypothetical protein
MIEIDDEMKSNEEDSIFRRAAKIGETKERSPPQENVKVKE